jgi:hypothetical protein
MLQSVAATRDCCAAVTDLMGCVLQEIGCWQSQLLAIFIYTAEDRVLAVPALGNIYICCRRYGVGSSNTW